MKFNKKSNIRVSFLMTLEAASGCDFMRTIISVHSANRKTISVLDKVRIFQC